MSEILRESLDKKGILRKYGNNIRPYHLYKLLYLTQFTLTTFLITFKL